VIGRKCLAPRWNRTNNPVIKSHWLPYRGAEAQPAAAWESLDRERLHRLKDGLTYSIGPTCEKRLVDRISCAIQLQWPLRAVMVELVTLTIA
jgi:hypothetical protein